MKTTNQILLAMLAFVFLTASKPKEIKPFPHGKDWIPTNFDVRKSVLLVQNFKALGYPEDHKACTKVTDQMKAFMKEYYPYKYEFVSETDLNTDKFADKEKYPYLLTDVNSVRNHESTRTTSHQAYSGIQSNHYNGFQGQTTSSQSSFNVFHLHDRKADKHYPDTKRGNGFVMTTFRPTVATLVHHMKALK